MGKLLGERIENYINRDSRSRADLVLVMAERTGLTPSGVYDILSGYTKCPPMERLEGIAKVLNIPVETLRTVRDRDCKGGITIEDVFGS